MSELEQLKQRLLWISEMVDENFFEYDEKDECLYIPDKYKEYKSIIQEVFYISAMGEIDFDKHKKG